MDLFRRIFGKVGEEEIPLENPKKQDESDLAAIDQNTLVTDELDPSTHPVNTSASTHSISSPIGVTQPLNQELVIGRHRERLTFGQATDVGLVRTNNQDSALSFFFTSTSVDEQPDFGLFVVADGMGGHHDGEKASAITTRVLGSQVTQSIYLPMISGENDEETMPITEAMISAVRQANLEVIRQVPEGGTTVTAVAIVGDLAHIAHVGDSRAYIITSTGVDQVTRDHSLVQRLIELDQLTPNEAATHPQANVLYRAIGQNEHVEVDALTRRLPPNCRLLICSDGLWGQVEEEEIFDIAMNTPDPQRAAEKLVALANTRGGKDNTTVILLRIS